MGRLFAIAGRGNDEIGSYVSKKEFDTWPITVGDGRRQIQQFMTAGARDYLTKPLDVTKFSRVIEESAWPSTDSKTLIQKPNGIEKVTAETI